MKRSKIMLITASMLAALTVFGGCSFLDKTETSKETEEETTAEETTAEETTEETTEATTEKTTEETTEETTEATTEETTEATEESKETEETDATEESKEPADITALPNYTPDIDFPEFKETMEIENDLTETYVDYVNQVLAPVLGVSAPFETTFEIDDESHPKKDYVPELGGITGCIMQDLDADGTLDIFVTGFYKTEAKGKAKEKYTYQYIPYVILVQSDYDTVGVKDTLLYSIEDPNEYEFYTTNLTSTQSFTNNYTYYLSNEGTLVLTITSSGFLSDGIYGNALEFDLIDGKLVPLKMLNQLGIGSSDFEYKVFDLTNPDDKGTELESENELIFNEAVQTVWKDLNIGFLNIKFEGKDDLTATYTLTSLQ